MINKKKLRSMALLVSLIATASFTSVSHASMMMKYGIETCQELQQIGQTLPANAEYTLTKDIDCTATNPNNSNYDAATYPNNGFLPINNFTGTFDGQNHTIFGLYIHPVPLLSYTGLFGKLGNGAQISRVKLVDIDVEGPSWTGALVALNEHQTVVHDVYVSGIVTGYGSTGGIIGSTKNTTAYNLEFEGTVKSGDQREVKSTFGGIIGSGNKTSLYGGKFTGRVIVENSYNVGGAFGYLKEGTLSNIIVDADIYAPSTNGVGGIVGTFETESSVSNIVSMGHVRGKWTVGGFFGTAYIRELSNSYSSANVVASGSHVGGLIGRGRAYVTNSYSSGLVKGLENVGGLFGSTYSAYSGDATIENSLSYSPVVGTSNVGALVGFLENNSYKSLVNNYIQKESLVSRDGGITYSPSDLTLAVGNRSNITSGIAVVDSDRLKSRDFYSSTLHWSDEIYEYDNSSSGKRLYTPSRRQYVEYSLTQDAGNIEITYDHPEVVTSGVPIK
ncbi:hypothetical protein M9194_11625 [Vibrio sp. S4M6]|uniref:hypothetical protein n=1 Tax=Vibrio sinus TaxID=2946865 RepID=UPI00202A70B4|nr:hypothetical protein [Vibrio sinus]MCL9782076.1 hypothetical protein [Vibrio sinus]